MNRRHLAALAVFFVLLVTIRLGMRYRTAPGASQELAMRAEAEGVAAERDTSVNVDGAPPEAAELLRSGRSTPSVIRTSSAAGSDS
ncbi:MAG: hypothetical protein M3409_06290, partial [Gemmatimonadota bacterium]|nr:hypothetical protein [Gemmatimonadota bacterium]